MSSTTYRGVIKEGRVILQQPSIPLADGTEVLVTPIPAEPGTPTAVSKTVYQAFIHIGLLGPFRNTFEMQALKPEE